jgi:hypothetical protein
MIACPFFLPFSAANGIQGRHIKNPAGISGELRRMIRRLPSSPTSSSEADAFAPQLDMFNEYTSLPREEYNELHQYVRKR